MAVTAPCPRYSNVTKVTKTRAAQFYKNIEEQKKHSHKKSESRRFTCAQKQYIRGRVKAAAQDIEVQAEYIWVQAHSFEWEHYLIWTWNQISPALKLKEHALELKEEPNQFLAREQPHILIGGARANIKPSLSCKTRHCPRLQLNHIPSSPSHMCCYTACAYLDGITTLSVLSCSFFIHVSRTFPLVWSFSGLTALQ